MENLDRGLVAVRSGSGNYVGWRMLGHEYRQSDPSAVAYNLYRDGSLVATVTDSTNYQDDGASATASYTVSAVIDGVECAPSQAVQPWGESYLSIPVTPPPSGTTPSGETFTYNTATETRSSGAINDGTPGDVDGDGQYEIITIWEPSNSQDNSNAGHTGYVYMDCYKLDGRRLWRLNLGPNIRAGAHYTQTLVYDFDGDGKAEVAVKTAPGTTDGTGAHLSRGPAADDDNDADYRNSDGYVLDGPEYLTVFNGETGAELATVDFEVARGSVGSWGDTYGNRVDRFTASVAFVSDEGDPGSSSGRPAIVMGRGYYQGQNNKGRTTFTAWSWRDGVLDHLWTFEANDSAHSEYTGQGCHSVMVADVDGDGAQEIVTGGNTIDSDGSPMCTTGYGHGDALHVSDFVPSRPGLEVFQPHEDGSFPNFDVHDARTCEIITEGAVTGDDTGRGVAGDIDPRNPGAEVWTTGSGGLVSATTGANLGAAPAQVNFLVWWDADESRETLDKTAIYKANGTQLLSATGAMNNNWDKATPTLTADLIGDWREEVIWRTPTSDALRVYTTTAVTSRRIYTLMHDPQYRMNVSSELASYNQPPHPSFHIGDGMEEPPTPDIHVK